MADRGRLYYDSNGELWEVDPNATINGTPDPGDLQAVRIGRADVVSETFIEATLSSGIAGVAQATYTNIVDSESEDNRNEFNASQQFTPDSTGWYRVDAVATIDGTDGDRSNIRVRNVTGGTTVYDKEDGLANGTRATLEIHRPVELISGQSYEIQARSQSSQFDIDTVGTYVVIRKAVVHP